MNRQEIIDILNNPDYEALFRRADETRKIFKGDNVHLRALIEFSNICKRNCLYCGLQANNKNIKRYSMTQSEIIKQAHLAFQLGYKTIVLQSGESNFFDTDEICKIIKEIKKFDVALTLSIGEKTYDEYKAFKAAGADRYLLRIETTDSALYEKMHPNASLDNRIECLINLKSLGYETGSGSLIGLPYQTIESLADDILFFKEMDFDMIGIGPFIAHPDTALKDSPNGDYFLSLKVMALIRILLKDINIPATTAMETIYPNGRLLALQAGANVIMPNLTPLNYARNYEIYPNKSFAKEEFSKEKEKIEREIKSIKRNISKDKGFRKS